MLQERTVSRTLGKNHQTKPPAFTESTDPAAPSLRPCPPCVLPAASTTFFPLPSIVPFTVREKDRSGGRERKVIAAVLKRRRSGISPCIRPLFHHRPFTLDSFESDRNSRRAFSLCYRQTPLLLARSCKCSVVGQVRTNTDGKLEFISRRNWKESIKSKN